MAFDLADLSPEWQERIRPHLREADGKNLSDIAQLVCELRDEYVDGRRESGIEEIWYEAERAYAGIDDANAGEYPNSRWSKPLSGDGPITKTDRPSSGQNEQPKSTIYVNITQRYVNAGAAKVAEILLPADGQPFSIEPTPVPELVDAKDDNRPVRLDDMPGAPVAMRPARPDEIPPSPPAAVAPASSLPGQPTTLPGAVPAAPGGPAVPPGAAAAPPMVPLRPKDLAEEKEAEAAKAAKKAEKRIYDWLVESKYPTHKRNMIHDGARMGVGVLKGPYPVARQALAMQGEGDSIAVTFMKKVVPGVKWVDPWNCFPDPTCGENIQNGDGFFEREYLTEKQLRKLKDEPGYIAEAIDLVIKEGPRQANPKSEGTAPRGDGHTIVNTKGKFETWYGYLNLKREQIECLYRAGRQQLKTTDRERKRKSFYVIVTVVNDTVIRGIVNPLDTGRFPYHAVPWERRAGHWAGRGIAEQLKAPQRIVNGATRAMLDNAGISAGGQIVVNRAALEPADGAWNLTPNKIWYTTADGEEMPATQMFATFDIPNQTDKLIEIVTFGQRQAEEVTNIPLVTQGQSGPTSPETYGGMQLQNNNANQMLRAVAASYDDNETEPLIGMCYESLLLDPDVPADEKGDFQIKANGSSVLVERAIQQQQILQYGALSLNPAYGLDPQLWAKEALIAARIDPTRLQMTEERKKEEAAKQPPAPPQIEVAKIRAETDKAKLAQEAQLEGQRLELDRDDVESDRVVALREIEARYQSDLEELKQGFEALKVKLAETTMKLNLQRELARETNAVKVDSNRQQQGQEGGEAPKPSRKIRRQRRSGQVNGAPQVATPAIEPPQRAPAGQAFQA